MTTDRSEGPGAGAGLPLLNRSWKALEMAEPAAWRVSLAVPASGVQLWQHLMDNKLCKVIIYHTLCHVLFVII